MPVASDPGFLVLHALRLKGFADTPAVAATTGLEADEAATFLEKAAASGHVSRREGRLPGWALTADGRARHGELISDEVERAGAREVLEDAYRDFMAVNNELLTVCTDWQLKGGVLNDHRDAAYDNTVVKRLVTVDSAVQPVCARLAGAFERFGRYGPLLHHALRRVEAGEGEWFAKPLIDSYHTVWFELHEDLLATLGIERSKEGPPA